MSSFEWLRKHAESRAVKALEDIKRSNDDVIPGGIRNRTDGEPDTPGDAGARLIGEHE